MESRACGGDVLENGDFLIHGHDGFTLVSFLLRKGKVVIYEKGGGVKKGKLSRFSRCDASPQQLPKMSFIFVIHLAPMENAAKVLIFLD